MRLKPRGFHLIGVTLLLGDDAWVHVQTAARIVKGVDWSGRGVWLKADLHTHTRFSDGARTVDDIVAAAARHGCDVVAITDHTDPELKAATPAYLEAIRAAQARTPEVTVITGVESNVPPGKGQEHATVLFPTNVANLETLAAFKERFDDWRREGENVERAREALVWLAGQDPAPIMPIVMFNHPGRLPDSTSAPRQTFDALKRMAPSILIGMEGAPGHQRTVPLGSYKSAPPVDRWDPLVAEIGGAWDQWLRAGLDVWAAMASSDFHDEQGDFAPCEFANTWVHAPDRTVDGVIRALRAGRFFGEHGHIVTNVELEARLDGLDRPVLAGETLAAAPGANVTLTLQLKVGDHDYLGRQNHIDTVELIGISDQGAQVMFAD